MTRFHTCKLTPAILDGWIHNDLNVLLIGERGVGKTHQVLDAFKRNNLKFSYLSGSTLDPWLHVIGVPKEVTRDDGTLKLDFIRPETLDESIEAIFLDEYNRTSHTVRNALLELQQFKSINGKRFPNLKIVWAAINPPKEETDDYQYDVDQMDPAQMDRFQIIVELPNKPCKIYFKNKFGDYSGKTLVEWWDGQSKDAQGAISPRRLDYIGESFLKGIDIRWLLPVSANAGDLVKKLSLTEDILKAKEILEHPTTEGMKLFFNTPSMCTTLLKDTKNDNYWNWWKLAPKEMCADYISDDTAFRNFAVNNAYVNNNTFYKDILDNMCKASPESKIAAFVEKFKKTMVELNIKTDSTIDNVISSTVPFKILDGSSKSNSPIFMPTVCNTIMQDAAAAAIDVLHNKSPDMDTVHDIVNRHIKGVSYLQLDSIMEELHDYLDNNGRKSLAVHDKLILSEFVRGVVMRRNSSVSVKNMNNQRILIGTVLAWIKDILPDNHPHIQAWCRTLSTDCKKILSSLRSSEFINFLSGENTSIGISKKISKILDDIENNKTPIKTCTANNPFFT